MGLKKTCWIHFLSIAYTCFNSVFPNSAYAQISSDSTLPTDSKINKQGNINIIENGTTAGTNLFHSFKEFSIPTGSEAHFNNAVDISNIITRVTGKSISNIDGLIKANGTANLFLINPSGIVFGENARLDIGGSFVGSTADSLKFDDGSFFSTKSTKSQPLLTVNVPIGLQLGSNQISNIVNTGKLSVNPGKNITLVGDRVEHNGTLKADGGQISIAAISKEGLASLGQGAELLSIEYQSNNINTPQSDAGTAIIKGRIGVNKKGVGNPGKIVLQAQDSIEFIKASIQSSNGGDINIQTKKISVIDSIIESSLNSKVNDKAGNIFIQANSINITDTRNQRGTTRISSQVKKDAQGDGGNIDINTDLLFITNKARITAGTRGKGNAGSVLINASDAIELLNGDIFSQVDSNGIGNSGNINIQARSLKLDGGDGNRALLNTNVRKGGTGKAGTILVDVKDKIELINGGRIVSNLEKEANGTGGNIFINTRLLFLERGGRIQALTEGMGRAGNIHVQADESVLISGNPEYISSAGIYTSSEQGAGGEGGNINIVTSKLNISDNAVLNARSRSSFQGGNIKTEVDTLEMTDGGQILTTAFADGNSGDIKIDAKENITISGSDSSYFSRQVKLFNQKRNADSLIANSTPNSGLLARNRGTNNGGKIVIKTRELTVKDGGILSSESIGKGNAGNIKIDANFVELIGGGQIITNSKDSGNAGNIIFNADKTDTNRILISGKDPNYLDRFTQASKLVEEGVFSEISEIIPNDGSNSALLAKTQGSGGAGSMTINAQELIITNQAEVSASTSIASTGSGGSITLNVQKLGVRDRAQVAVSSNGTGNAGNVKVNARFIRLNNDASLSANTQNAKIEPETKQATIDINSQDLVMRRGSNIFTNAKGENVQGGNINIDSNIIAAFENSDISANSENSRGGKVTIEAQGIFGTQFRFKPTPQSDITASGASEDLSGNVEIVNLENNPTDDLVELPTTPIDTQLAQSCTAGSSQAQSRFEITGRGGLPILPNEALNPDAVSVDLVTLKPSINNISKPFYINEKTSAPPKKIVEATGWVRNKKGEIFFVADAVNINSRSSWHKPSDCNAAKSN